MAVADRAPRMPFEDPIEARLVKRVAAERQNGYFFTRVIQESSTDEALGVDIVDDALV